MPKISVSIIARNEAKHLKACLDSVAWAYEVVVVDCESGDATGEIARAAGARVFVRRNEPNLNINKQFAVQQCSGDWVLYLDPDERCVPAFAKAVMKAAERGEFAAYTAPRRNFYFGRWLARGGKYPDTQLRFFKRGHASFACRDVHERLQVDGRIGALGEAFEHYPYDDASDMVRKMDFYSTIKAKSPVEMRFSRGPRRFLVNYFLRGGFLDGWQGFAAAVMDLFGEILTYIKKYNDKIS